MAKNKTRIYSAFILDCSGSMVSIASETVNLFNEQVAAIEKAAKDKKADVRVSLVTFNNTVHTPKYWNAHPENMKRLTTDLYKPDGWTALNDAIGNTINALANTAVKEPGYDNKFVVTIITDGAENRSATYTQESIKKLIEKKQSKGNWTIVYLGANVDVAEVARGYSIPLGNTLSWTSTPRGVNTLSDRFGCSISSNFSNIISSSNTTNWFGNQTTTKDDEKMATNNSGQEATGTQ